MGEEEWCLQDNSDIDSGLQLLNSQVKYNKNSKTGGKK